MKRYEILANHNLSIVVDAQDEQEAIAIATVNIDNVLATIPCAAIIRGIQEIPATTRPTSNDILRIGHTIS